MLNAPVPRNLRVRASIQLASTRVPARAFLLVAAVLFLGGLLVIAGADVMQTVKLTSALILLSLLGQTLNVMTLGGLALAVGILVDDATVEIENIHRNLAQGKPLRQAILDGAQQIATPAFVSTLAICIVFVPVVFLSGAAD